MWEVTLRSFLPQFMTKLPGSCAKTEKVLSLYMLYHIKLGSVQKIFVYVGIEKEIYITSLKHFG